MLSRVKPSRRLDQTVFAMPENYEEDKQTISHRPIANGWRIDTITMSGKNFDQMLIR